MRPNYRFALDCQCGRNAFASSADAGRVIMCDHCDGEILVPNLGVLRKSPSLDVSAIGRVEQQIARGQGFFSGRCQLCEVSTGSEALLAQVTAWRKGSEYARSFTVPCILCEVCGHDFRRGIWAGRVQWLFSSAGKLFWLLLTLLIASMVAVVLPLVGIAAVLSFGSSLLLYLFRIRSNPYLRRHLNRICQLDEIVADADEYRVVSRRWVSVAPK